MPKRNWQEAALSVAFRSCALFHRHTLEPEELPILPYGASVGTTFPSRYGHQSHGLAWLSPADFDQVHLLADCLVPLMARDLPRGNFRSVPLELPKGIYAASSESHGWNVRAVIDDCYPLPYPPDPIIWGRRKRYYDVGVDEFKEGKCGIVLRIDVALAPAEESRGHVEDEQAGIQPFARRPDPRPCAFPRPAYRAMTNA
jgi:hypothetical protein